MKIPLTAIWSLTLTALLSSTPLHASAQTPQEPAAASRPQQPIAPFPYQSSDVHFAGGQPGVNLAGVLTLPVTDEPVPAVILLAGSGRTDRDETFLDHKPMLVWSDALTRAGFAVLRYDKRGVGESTGDFRSASPLDFKADAQAALAFLAGRPEIDGRRMAVVGHSEGGTVAALMAADPQAPAAVVSLAGMIAPFDEQIVVQELVTARDVGADADYDTALRQAYQKVFQALLLGGDAERLEAMQRISTDWLAIFKSDPNATAAQDSLLTHPGLIASRWFRTFVGLRVEEALASSAGPVLLVNGSTDQQVDASANLAAAREALGRETQMRRTVILPGLNHLFQESASGSTGDYGSISQTVSPSVIREVIGFLADAM